MWLSVCIEVLTFDSTYDDFIALPHWATLLSAPCPDIPFDLIIRTLNKPFVCSVLVLLNDRLGDDRSKLSKSLI